MENVAKALRFTECHNFTDSCLVFGVNFFRWEEKKTTHTKRKLFHKIAVFFQVTPIATGLDFPLNIDFKFRSHKATKLDLDSKCKLNGMNGMNGGKQKRFFKVYAPSKKKEEKTRKTVSFCGQTDQSCATKTIENSTDSSINTIDVSS